MRLDGGTATWLWRTLRSVEAAGLDANQVASDAITAAPLTGARDVVAVIDARIRWATAGITPAPWRPWSERVPQLADPEGQRFVAELAAAMDARRARIGEHAAATEPTWAINALGLVPEDRWTGWRGPSERRPSAPTESSTVTNPTQTQLVPSPLTLPRPDLRGWPPILLNSIRTRPGLTACRTARCCCAERSTKPKPVGPRHTRAVSCARSVRHCWT